MIIIPKKLLSTELGSFHHSKGQNYLENAQLSAGQQIDNRVDQNLAGLAAKVKSIIKDTVKSHSIKRDAIEFDQSLLECELTATRTSSKRFPHSATASSSSSLPNLKKSKKIQIILISAARPVTPVHKDKTRNKTTGVIVLTQNVHF